jgi:hypothetical protein
MLSAWDFACLARQIHRQNDGPACRASLAGSTNFGHAELRAANSK